MLADALTRLLLHHQDFSLVLRDLADQLGVEPCFSLTSCSQACRTGRPLPRIQVPQA